MSNLSLCGLPQRLAALSLFVSTAAVGAPDRIIIIRHGEKPAVGDNLSCKGKNRALQLPNVLFAKFGVPDHTYVPSLKEGGSTNHARMLQTVTPFAVKYNLQINSGFGEADVKNVAADVLKRSKTVLMVWDHSQIQALAQSLGASNAPKWDGNDFDSIWIITFADGKASLKTNDKQGLAPAEQCSF
jgi:hypothetical protein